MSRVKFNLLQQSSGIINKIKQGIKKGKSVLVGVQGEGTYRENEDGTDSDVSNVDVAVFNEFGTERIPERSFIRASIIENAEKYKEMNKIAAKQILNGTNDVDTYLDELGNVAVSDMKQYAVDLRTPENAESTIARKGTDNPLVETTQMVNSIVHVVVDNQDLQDDT